MTRRLSVALGVLAIAIAGCGDDGGGSAGEGAAKMTVGVQTKVLQTYYPQLAQELGFLKEEGLEIKIIETQNPANAIQGLIGGSLDIYLGGPEALTAAQKGADVRLVAAASNRSIWDIVAQKDIGTVHDLKGKTFGVSEITSISTATSKQALRKQGVNPDDVKYVVAGGTGNRYTALESNRIDAAPLGIPVNYQAIETGKFKDLGGTDTGLGAPPIAAVVFTVSKRWADENRETLLKFLRAYQKVINALYDPAMTDKIVEIASKGIEVEPKYMRRAIDTLFLDKKTGGQILPKDGHIDEQALQNAADAFLELGALPGKIDATEYMDMSYLEAAQESLKK